ncbi:MAG TPA: hypothetical protein VEI02_08585, partial [Planctomycetota bacterium]|nr:hypothetical protein [Planctomycetota bacterium]
RIAGVGPASIGTSLPLTLKDPYHPGAGWLLGLGVSGGDYGLGVALTEQTLPLIPDALTVAVFQPGSAGLVTAVAGVLNGFGEATTTLLIPAQPVLVGFEISMVFVSTSPTALDGVVGVSPRYVAAVVN